MNDLRTYVLQVIITSDHQRMVHTVTVLNQITGQVTTDLAKSDPEAADLVRRALMDAVGI